MKRQVLLVLINNRKDQAGTVQKILTEWGCIIKTRLGLHDGVLDSCSETGLLFIELVGEKEKNEALTHKLNLLEGVTTEYIELSVE